MLHLTMKRGNSVLVNVPPSNEAKIIQLIFKGRSGDDLKIGVDAPKECRISREETHTEYHPKQLDMFEGE